jgi:hypothetical protein
VSAYSYTDILLLEQKNTALQTELEAVKGELTKKDERIAELVRWHEKKDRKLETATEALEQIADVTTQKGFEEKIDQRIARAALASIKEESK